MAELDALMRRAMSPFAAPSAPAAPAAANVASGGFAGSLAKATMSLPVGATGGGTLTGMRMLAAAQAEVGHAEVPPGSNDGPRLGTYRAAVAGAAPGQPWCAYFVSWAAAQAGAPLGDGGQGFGAVSQIAAWAQQTGRMIPPGQSPLPGDIILYGDRHVGIVESVAADGSLVAVEGNSSDAVSRVTRRPGEATGFVRLP
jgi:hypothetical protein